MTIKDIRIERKMTQDELAEAVGCSRITIARMEAGRIPVTLKIIDGLSNALKLPVPVILDMLRNQEGDETQ